MPTDNLNLLQDDGDVVIEGSELHQALLNAGLTNFDSVPKVKMELSPSENYVPLVETKCTWSKRLNKLHGFHRFIFQENNLRQKQLNIILQANILLDDHAAMINELLENQNECTLRKFIRWLPLIGSTAGLLAFAVIKQNIRPATLAGLIFSSTMCVGAKNLFLAYNLQKLVHVQSDLHNSIKYSLKILRRYCKRSIISELHQKNETLGSEKYEIILEIKKTLFEIFENVSNLYYEQGIGILKILPSILHSKCLLTKVEAENNSQNGDDYKKIKNLYYTYILAQSETMFALANAYNGKAQDMYFKISHKKLQRVINKLNVTLKVYKSKLYGILQVYKISEIQPVQHVYKGIPSSKWQDVYVHLDITSHRIQLAYIEIIKILELLDANNDDKDDDDLILPITEKMNKAYKQIENARCFAEFSSLLIAKAQCKTITTQEIENESENLFSADKDTKTVVIIDKDREIEDEVFEEYIKEEYLKPLIEGSDGIIDEYKLDKLLKKNFMSELKEALVDKQKSMTKRELKALKRMYERIRKDSNISQSDLDKIGDNISSTMIPPVPPPPPVPPLPPPVLENRVVAETEEPEENIEIVKKNRGPVPLPRVKMLQTPDQMPYVQKFSISECTPNFKFPSFKGAEETFLGSGENSEEENEENDNESDNVEKKAKN